VEVVGHRDADDDDGPDDGLGGEPALLDLEQDEEDEE
jgi:hypothetical protein